MPIAEGKGLFDESLRLGCRAKEKEFRRAKAEDKNAAATATDITLAW